MLLISCSHSHVDHHRPNSGFMDQLRLWEDMGCHVKDDNKKYRAYRLQCKAREIEGIIPSPTVTFQF